MKHDASVAESTELSDVDAAADAYISVKFVYSISTGTLRLPDFVGPKGRQPFRQAQDNCRSNSYESF
ncbi:MAG: hypothetical protein ACYC27_02770 [Armatimonadota bacterium]